MDTKHNHKCKMAFGKPTKEIGACPRCDELRQGAQPRIHAYVKRWADSKRYGFIAPTEGEFKDRDVFIHYSAIYGEGFQTLTEDQQVICEIVDGAKGPQAIKVEKVKP